MQTKFLYRWLIVIALCFTYSFLQAQLVTKVEYFFDTDPGIGNGTAINLTTPSVNVDSTFTFNVTSLSNGLHQVYVRSQDGFNKWSLNYSGSFIKTNGSGAALSIAKLEYYVDTDPGYGNATNIPLSAAASIVDSTFDFLVPDNGANTRYLAVRAMDTRGQWSLLYDNTVDMCALYKAKPNFSWIRYGNNLSFVDSSINNPTHKLLWKFDNLGIDSVSNPQFTYPQGNYSATLIAGIGCRKDSITQPLFMGLEKYYPDSALTGGNVSMAFFGGGLDTTAIISVTNNSGTLLPIGKIKVDPVLTMALFDLHNAAPGNYDVHIHFPGGYDTTVTNGLRVIAAPGGGLAYEPDIDITFVGPTRARSGGTVKVNMIVTNNGGMLAEQVPVNFTLSRDGVGLLGGYNYKVTYVPPTNPPMPYEDSLPHYSGLDSLYNMPYHGRMHNMIIPYLNAGQSFTIPIYVSIPLNAPEGSITEITGWAGNRMLGSPFRQQWGDCVDAAVDAAVGFIPVASCVNSVWNYFAYGLYSYGSNSAGELGWNTAGVLLSCVPGVNVAQAVVKSKIILQIIEHPKAFADITHTTISGVNGANGACAEAEKWDREKIRKQHHSIAVDPNEIDGPDGYTTNNYIKGTTKVVYRVGLENLPTAAANAQRVFIADTLDKNKFDLSTFELLNYSIGDSTFSIPLQRKEYTNTVNLIATTGLHVRFNAKLDTTTGILRFSFLSIDPVTRDTLFGSDIRGFLPPDIDDISGRAAVAYGLMYKKNLVTNDQVTNKASIIFDYNAPIITNTWLNTIDKTAPTGVVAGGTLINDTTVRLNLTGTDAESGLKGFDLYISENLNPYVKVGPVFGDTLRFTGALNSNYRFYAVPFDSAYNILPKSPVAEYTITFSSPLPITLIYFTGYKQNNDALLSWKTTDAINFSHFEIERSTDGIAFVAIAQKPATNVSGDIIYSYTDANAAVSFSNNGKIFYRLKMVDKDGRFKYSQVIRISLNKLQQVLVYPNPAGKEIFIQSLQYYTQLQIIDMSGRVVLSETIKPGIQSININKLTAGTYIIKLLADDDVQTLKFIKN